jgi:Peptidase family M23/Bacterial Ig-like domain (group 2)
MACLCRCSRRVGAVLALPTVLLSAACKSESTPLDAVPTVTVTIAPQQTTLAIGATATLVATVRDADGQELTGRPITWTSGAPTIASVSTSGLVRALDAGVATISAVSDPGLGLARVVVQEDVRLPLPGLRHWLLLTETGTAAAGCAEDEGGLRHSGGRDCTHGGVSRYSLDFAAVTEENGEVPADSATVLTAADGQVIDICLLPQAVTCGPNGAFIAVEHRGGLRTIYAHLEAGSITLRRKMKVARGQPVGTMARGGGEPAPWVHFELRFENRGAEAAAVLEGLLVSGRRLTDYRVAVGEQRFYYSSNAAAHHPPGDDNGGTPLWRTPVRRR